MQGRNWAESLNQGSVLVLPLKHSHGLEQTVFFLCVNNKRVLTRPFFLLSVLGSEVHYIVEDET